jgi:ABC-type metal ion transport system substrate-binding protein
MRSLSLLLPASLLVLASNAVAQTATTLTTESGATSRVQVIASAQPFAFYDSDAEWISGAYAMSNGWRLKVDPSSDGIVAQIDKRHPVKLTAVSRDKYVTLDGNIAMEFNRGQQGDEMLMSYVPDPRTAQVVVNSATSTATLAQR